MIDIETEDAFLLRYDELRRIEAIKIMQETISLTYGINCQHTEISCSELSLLDIIFTSDITCITKDCLFNQLI